MFKGRVASQHRPLLFLRSNELETRLETEPSRDTLADGCVHPVGIDDTVTKPETGRPRIHRIVPFKPGDADRTHWAPVEVAVLGQDHVFLVLPTPEHANEGWIDDREWRLGNIFPEALDGVGALAGSVVDQPDVVLPGQPLERLLWANGLVVDIVSCRGAHPEVDLPDRVVPGFLLRRRRDGEDNEGDDDENDETNGLHWASLRSR